MYTQKYCVILTNSVFWKNVGAHLIIFLNRTKVLNQGFRTITRKRILQGVSSRASLIMSMVGACLKLATQMETLVGHLPEKNWGKSKVILGVVLKTFLLEHFKGHQGNDQWTVRQLSLLPPCVCLTIDFTPNRFPDIGYESGRQRLH